jgi:hypothetical protein
MFPPRTAVRSIVACTLACGLLATSSAVARPIDDARTAAPTSSLAGTTSDTPRQDLRSPDTRDAAAGGVFANPMSDPVQDLRSPDARDAADTERIAKAMEQYYATYDEPKPITALAEPAPDDSPFLLISVIAGGLALMVASVALVRRRHTTRVA